MKHITVFDLDHTLLSVNSSYVFGSLLFKKKLFSTLTMFQLIGIYGLHKLDFFSLEKTHQKIFSKLFQGRSFSSIQQHIEPFLDTLFEQHLNAPIIDALHQAQREHHHTLILSSSPDFLVAPIAKRLGVSDWKATHYAVDEQHCFSHVDEVLEGQGKAKYLSNLLISNHLNKSAVTSYSDSHLDLPFLQLAEHVIAVNPTKQLRKECLRNNWEIIK